MSRGDGIGTIGDGIPAAGSATVILAVDGMTCGACAARVQRVLNRSPGVHASVNYATGRARVDLDPGSPVDVDAMVVATRRLGYVARPLDVSSAAPHAATGHAAGGDGVRRLGLRLAVALLVLAPLTDLTFVLALSPGLRFPGWQGVLVVLALPVVTWCAWPFHMGAVRAARHGATSMDTLISTGIVAATGWSLYSLAAHDQPEVTDQWWGLLLRPGGSIYLDVTRQKNTEAELRKTRAEALHLNQRLVAGNERLAAGNDQLREIDRLKTEFIASVSHELRTPLTSIRGYLEMLRDPSASLAPEMHHRFLAIIDRNSEHLLSLIEDLLILSKMDSGQYAALDREIDLHPVVEMAETMLRPAVQQGGIVLVKDLDDDLPRVLGDAEQLERVMINLLSNAVKFSEPGQHVVIRGRRQGGMVCLSVKDEGIGIAVEDQSQLFTRFFRTTAAKDRGIPGTGLGLAVVKGIVDGHGGTLRVDSELGRGTTISVLLSVAPGQV